MVRRRGLGHVVTQESHYFSELGVSLPRGELIRQEQQRAELEERRHTCGASCSYNAAPGSPEKVPYLRGDQVNLLKQAVAESHVPAAACNCGAFVMQPGEQAPAGEDPMQPRPPHPFKCHGLVGKESDCYVVDGAVWQPWQRAARWLAQRR